MPRAPQHILDELLVLDAKQGRPAAWRSLVQRWHPLLLRRAVRLLGDPHLAADATQEAWVSIARSLPRLQDPARFAPWAYRILARRCADQVRTAQHQRLSDRAASSPTADGPTPQTEDTDRLRRAIARLPADQRLLLSLRYAEGIPLDAIAELLGIPPGTVKSRLHTAREQLRERLEPAPKQHPPHATQGAIHGRA